MPFFKIKGLSPALDGLVVEAEDSAMDPEFMTVKRIVNTNVMVGDRTLSFPVSDHGLRIRRAAHLTVIDDPQIREFSHTNPWGKCLFEGRYIKGSIEVAYAKFENATQVTLTEKQDNVSKTLFTGYFTKLTETSNRTGCDNEEVFTHVQETIEEHLTAGADVDDLIFKLKALQE